MRRWGVAWPREPLASGERPARFTRGNRRQSPFTQMAIVGGMRHRALPSTGTALTRGARLKNAETIKEVDETPFSFLQAHSQPLGRIICGLHAPSRRNSLLMCCMSAYATGNARSLARSVFASALYSIKPLYHLLNIFCSRRLLAARVAIWDDGTLPFNIMAPRPRAGYHWQHFFQPFIEKATAARWEKKTKPKRGRS